MNIAKHIANVVFIAFVAFAIYALFGQPDPTQGSVEVASEYYSTTTDSVALHPEERVLKSMSGGTIGGSVGQVTITGAGAGRIELYNATTSVAANRAAQYSTSSILIASFPASAAAGTYTFDATFDVGLLLVTPDAVAPTSTVTWR
jgi:hypothetical protein